MSRQPRFKACQAVSAFIVLALPTLVAPVMGDQSPHEIKPVDVRSGRVFNKSMSRRAAFSEVVHVPDTGWLRLRFDRADLGRAPAGGEPTIIRMTSLLDGAVQRLNAATLEEWQFTSAYFNGSAVQIELITDPGAASSEIILSGVYAGPVTDITPLSICGLDDDRVYAEDPRIARTQPNVCTAWLIDDPNHTFLTAGHCTGLGAVVMEFNVPLSTATGLIQHPGPEDQYAVDLTSVQSSGPGGIGNDWAYFGCFPNSETGLTPFQAQGAFFVLADEPPPVLDQYIRVTGYGYVLEPMPLILDNALTTHAGPYISDHGLYIKYETDTTVGDSGSPVIDLSTDTAIAIHSHPGCEVDGGANIGTAIDHPGLLNALANPLGVCAAPPPVTFSFPDGLPELIDPDGTDVRVLITASDGVAVVGGSELMHISAGERGAAQEIPLMNISSNLYIGSFPPMPCGSVVDFHFSAQTDDGTSVPAPIGAPINHFQAMIGLAFDIVFEDSFETETGWEVENTSATVSGSWERGIPVTQGVFGSPLADADGSGRCFVTGNAPDDSDVDGGATILISPQLDGSKGDPHVKYSSWFRNSFAGEPSSNFMAVEISNDDGANWFVLEIIGPTGPEVAGGWFDKSFRVADFLPPTSEMRVRFTVNDPSLSFVSLAEAGIDDFRLLGSEDGIVCETPCPIDLDDSGDFGMGDVARLLNDWGSCLGCGGDLDASGTVGFDDLLQFLASTQQCADPCPADLNRDGVVSFADMLILLTAWGSCESCVADLDDDDFVGFADLLIMLDSMGPC